MADPRVFKLKLNAFSIEKIQGCGEKLSIQVFADRKTKAGTPERYEIEFTFCRWGVDLILQGIKAMHEADRKRIAEETARISEEMNALQVTP